MTTQDMAEQNYKIEISETPIKDHQQFMDHEIVYKIHAPAENVTAFVGIHNSALGPALGGIRFKHYANEAEAIGDVLRLAEAMTWKNAAGGLAHGGGKSVIMAPKGQRNMNEVTRTIFAKGLNLINDAKPLYFGAQDMNCSEDDLNHMSQITSFIKGASPKDPSLVGGDPSPVTATGVYECMKVAAQYKLGKDSLKDIRIALQGLGSVGGALAEHLSKDGAILIGCDVTDEPFKELEAKGVEIKRVGLDEIYDVPADIFAPNAIGGTINDDTIGRLKTAGVKIICGAANNQQRDQAGGAESKHLNELGILYCPDYIVNAAGVIWVAKVGEDAQATIKDIRKGVPRRFKDVLDLHTQNPEQDLASIAASYSRKRVEAAEEKNAQLKAG